jgi:hypothetical protein
MTKEEDDGDVSRESEARAGDGVTAATDLR